MAFISKIAFYVPQENLSNDDLEKEFDGWSSTKILKKTGIQQRYIAKNEKTSEMAIKAGEALLKCDLPVDGNDIDYLLLCTQSPDYYLPTTACLVQKALGLKKSIGALDFNLGCSGYVYGLQLAYSLLHAGQARNVLLITSEKYSKYIHPKDKSTRTIFGDAASATLLSAESGFAHLESFDVGTDGSGFQNLIVPAGGDALPFSDETAVENIDESGNIRSLNNIYMNGPEIFTFTLDAVPLTINRILKKNALIMDEIDFFIFHQANKFMLETLRIRMNIPKEKFLIDMEAYGNTVSSTIPIVLHNAGKKKIFFEGARILLVGFGVGYSWGTVLITWKEQ